jgi:catechol 2,3-dioxygenase-like lactoylglutathione lyase family enzyme
MIECVFTLDYEIYGNGGGTLRDLVIEPTRRLAEVFHEFDAPFVVFAEAVEFAKMEEAGSDPDTAGVRAQLRELRAAGHEIALHLHPWWANAAFENGQWRFDWSERNICTLAPRRVEEIVSGAITYLRNSLEDPGYTPVSFRSGLWLMQPTPVIAGVLASQGVLVDSSVFKGGRVKEQGLDYRPALGNDGTWRFSKDVNAPDPDGILWEMPIHTQMVPFWQMLGRKRLKLHKKVPNTGNGTPLPGRWRNFLRFRYPRKLDFCRMTFEEMRESLEGATGKGPAQSGPVVAIGHSKDFVDSDAVRRFLDFLRRREIAVTTFARLFRDDLKVPSGAKRSSIAN